MAIVACSLHYSVLRPLLLFPSSSWIVAAANLSSENNRKKNKKPTVFEVQRAIGIADDNSRLPMQRGGGESSSIVDMLREESEAEKKLRMFAETLVERTEANEKSGQQILLVVCLSILPVWVLLLLIACGVIKLPVTVPQLEDFMM